MNTTIESRARRLRLVLWRLMRWHQSKIATDNAMEGGDTGNTSDDRAWWWHPPLFLNVYWVLEENMFCTAARWSRKRESSS